MPPPPPACLLLHLLRLLLLPPAGGGCRRIIRTFGGSPSWIGYAAAIATRVRQRARHVFAGERKAEETTKTRRDAETGQAVAHYSLLSMTTSDGAEPDMAAAIAARNACGAGQISSCGCSGDSGRGWSCLGHAGCVAALHSWRAAWGGCARRCRLGGWCVGGACLPACRVALPSRVHKLDVHQGLAVVQADTCRVARVLHDSCGGEQS